MTIPTFTRIALAPLLFSFDAIVQLLAATIVVTLLVWIVRTAFPNDPPMGQMKTFLTVFLVLLFCVFLLRWARLL